VSAVSSVGLCASGPYIELQRIAVRKKL